MTQKKTAATPKTVQVQLASGEKVEIGRIAFGNNDLDVPVIGWIHVKEIICDAIGGPIISTARELLESPAVEGLKAALEGGGLEAFVDENAKPADLVELVKNSDLVSTAISVLTEATTALPVIVREAVSASDLLTETLVRACVKGDLPTDIDALDMLELRDAAVSVNDFGRFIEREKNFWGGLLGQVMGSK